MKKTVIVGYGNMGSRYASHIYNGKIKDMSLYGIVCRNPEKQREIINNMPEVKVFPGEEIMLSERDNFDALIITTPHKEHIKTVKRAQRAGLHILCEKPLGITAQECSAVLAGNAEAKMVEAVLFNWRTKEIYRQLHAYLEGRNLGRLHQVVWVANFWYRPEFYHHASKWRISWSGEGGGLLINQCQHLLDMWNWLFGQPCEVFASLGYGEYNHISVDDKISLFLRHENGMWGNLISSSGDSPGACHLEIHGEWGKIVVEDNRCLRIYKNTASTESISKISREINPVIPFAEENREVNQKEDEYVAALQNFADAMELRSAPLAAFSDGQRALEIANSAYLSSWKSTAIPVPCDEEEYCRELKKRAEAEER